MVARRRFEFYLHRDGCAAAIRVLSTQRSVRRGDLIGMDLYLHSFGGRCDEKWRFSNKETAFFLEQGRGLF